MINSVPVYPLLYKTDKLIIEDNSKVENIEITLVIIDCIVTMVDQIDKRF